MQAIIAYSQLEIRYDCQAGCDAQMVISLVPLSTAFCFTDRMATPLTAEVCQHLFWLIHSPNFRNEAKSSYFPSTHYCAPTLLTSCSPGRTAFPPTY